MAAENGQTNAVGMNASLLKPACCKISLRDVIRCEIELTFNLLFLTFSFSLLELLVSSAKADLTLQDAVKNTALHLACSKVCMTIRWHCFILQQLIYGILSQVCAEIL